MSQSIEWRHDGARLVIPVIVYPPDTGADLSGIEGSALLDTGSTTTGITRRLATRLGLSGIGKRPMSTVGGDAQIERHIFRIGFFGSEGRNALPAFPCVFDEIVGFELRDGFSFDALIGMDILRQCELHLGKDRACRLTFG
jgi:hypothetical protein